MPSTLYFILMIFFGSALILSLIRLIRGPTLADRVVAFDLFGIIIAGVLGLYGVYHGIGYCLDIIAVLAMILFLSTAAFAAYIEKQKSRSSDNNHSRL